MDTQEEELGIVDVLVSASRHRGFIVSLAAIGAIAGLVVALLLPNRYTGTARLLPPQQTQSAAAALLGQLGSLALGQAGSFGLKNPADLYVGVLKSRTIADRLIDRFDLQALYEEDTRVEAREALAENTAIAVGKDGLIAVAFEDEDPERAAAVANAYVEELQSLTQSLAVTEAGQRRLFFEGQLKQAKSDLLAAEIAMKATQEKTGLIQLDDQGKAIIEAVAALRAQIAAKEVELRAMRSFATEQNADYVRAQQQYLGLRAELEKLERSKIAGGGDILVPAGKVPEAGLEFVRRFRDVKYHEAIFELLARQFEAAKIDEGKEAAVIQVVDRAIAPDRHSKPKRGLLVVGAALLGAALGVLFGLFRDAEARAAGDPVRAARFAALRRLFFLSRS